MAEEKKIIEEIEPCYVFDSDQILIDPSEIAYYKAILEEFQADNRLLGQVMHNGEYVIARPIRENLARLPKELAGEGDDVVEARSRVMAKDLFFTIEVESVEENFTASLYVTENVSGYRDLKSIKTFVARITVESKDGILEKAKQAFNVQKIVDVINEAQYMDLVMQIQQQIDYADALNVIADLNSQIYVLRMLELLETTPEGQKVIESYRQQIKVQKIKPSQPKQYIKLREILDKTIEEAGGLQKVLPEKQKEARAIKKEYAGPIAQVESMKGKTATKVVIKKDEQKAASAEKPAEKKPAAKKAAGKSDDGKGGAKDKGKGKDKGKDKKKDDKKKKDEKKKTGSVVMPRVAGRAADAAGPIFKSEGSPVAPAPSSTKLPPLARKTPKTIEEEATDNLFSAILSRNLEENPTKEEPQLDINEASANVLVGVSVDIEQVEIEL